MNFSIPKFIARMQIRSLEKKFAEQVRLLDMSGLYYLLKWRSMPSRFNSILWVELLSKLTSVCELMVIVYDDDDEFAWVDRLVAGKYVIKILSQESGRRYLRGVSYWDVHSGRLAYLAGVEIYLEELQPEVQKAVDQCLTDNEQRAYYRPVI